MVRLLLDRFHFTPSSCHRSSMRPITWHMNMAFSQSQAHATSTIVRISAIVFPGPINAQWSEHATKWPTINCPLSFNGPPPPNRRKKNPYKNEAIVRRHTVYVVLVSFAIDLNGAWNKIKSSAPRYQSVVFISHRVTSFIATSRFIMNIEEQLWHFTVYGWACISKLVSD